MSRTATVQVVNLGGGVNDFDSPDQIGPSECQNTSRNTRSDANGFKSRLGYTTFADTLVGATDGVRAIGAYIRNSASNDRLICIYNNKIYKIDPSSESTWTEIVTTYLTDDTNIDIVSFRDWMFIFNGVDKPLLVSNTTVTQSFTTPASLTTNTFLPAFGEVYQNSLWVSGVPTAPNTVYISRASTGTNPEYIYDFSGSLTSFGDAQELLFPSRVTAIRKLSTAIVVFTIDGAFYIPGLTEIGSTVTYQAQPIGGAGGCIAQKACTVVENDIYYITPQKEVKSIKRGFSDTLSMITTPLSVKVTKFLKEETSNTLTDTFSYYDPIDKLYKVYFRRVGEGQNGLRLVGDINNVDQNTGAPSWDIDDSVPFQCGYFYKGQSYVGSIVLGQVYNDEDGLADDDDANIEAIRDTKNFTTGNPTEYVKWVEARIFAEATIASTFTCNAYVDGNLVKTETLNQSDIPGAETVDLGGIGTETIGEYIVASDEVEGIDSATRIEFVKRLRFRQRGRKIKLSFVSDGVNNDYLIRAVEFDFIRTGRNATPLIER